MINVLKRIGKAAFLVSACSIAVGFAGPALAADYEISSTFVYQVEGDIYTLGDVRVVAIGETSGIVIPSGTEGPMAGYTKQVCPQFIDFFAENIGFCTVTTPEGDEYYSQIVTVPLPQDEWLPGATGANHGEFTYLGGTGRFEGLTGGGTFTSHNFGPMSNGRFVGFSEITGTYSLPE